MKKYFRQEEVFKYLISNNWKLLANKNLKYYLLKDNEIISINTKGHAGKPSEKELKKIGVKK